MARLGVPLLSGAEGGDGDGEQHGEGDTRRSRILTIAILLFIIKVAHSRRPL